MITGFLQAKKSPVTRTATGQDGGRTGNYLAWLSLCQRQTWPSPSSRATARATAKIAFSRTTFTVNAPSWISPMAAANIPSAGKNIAVLLCAEVEKAKAPRPRWPAGLSQGHGVFNYGLVCPTLKLITPSKALVVVRSSFGSIYLNCVEDQRYQFSGQFRHLVDQEKQCSRWWQIVSFRGGKWKTPRSAEGQTPGLGSGWWWRCFRTSGIRDRGSG